VLIAVLSFVAASALIVLLPGPDTLVVLRGLLRDGKQQARRTVLGVLTGLTVWATAAVVGLSALLRASHDGYNALRIIGGVYLVIVGVQAFRSRGASAEIDAADLGQQRRGVIGTGYVAGLTTDLLNPKVGVFFVTFLPAFVPHGANVNLMTAIFGATFVLETALYFLVFLAFADKLIARMKRPRFRAVLDRCTGAVLMGFGVRLALEA